MPPHGMDQGLPKPPLEIGSYFAGYRVLALIGQGGHACVFRVHDEFLDKYFALKVLYRAGGVTPEMMKRGQAEAQFLSSVRHPYIVEVIRAGIENGLLFIVMELLEGRALRLVQQQAGRLEVEEVLALSAQVAEAVAYAHEHKAIHRDLKPDNVFVCRENRAKVLDFGIAKLVDQGGWTTQRNIVVGTILYMSPEQVQGMKLGPETDVYSLGLIMFTLLFGRHPCLLDLESVSNAELARLQVMRVPPQLDEIAPHIPRYVARLVAKSLAKVPEERIRSMSEFATMIRAQLERYVGDTRQTGQALQTRDLSNYDFGGDFQVSLAGGRPDTATATDSLIAVQEQVFGAYAAQLAAPRTVEYGSPPSGRAPTSGERVAPTSGERAAPTSADKPTLLLAQHGGNPPRGSSPPHSPGIPVRSLAFESRPLSRATPTPSPTSLGRTAPPDSEAAPPVAPPDALKRLLGPYKTAVVAATYAGVGLGLGLAVLLAVRGGAAHPDAAVPAAAISVAGTSAAPPSVAPLATPSPVLEAPLPPPAPAPTQAPDPAAPAVSQAAAATAPAPKPAAPAARVAPVAAARPAPAKSADADPVLENMKATARHFHLEADRPQEKPRQPSALPFGDAPPPTKKSGSMPDSGL